jgi:peptidoglycan-associated lipoprotein
MKKVLLSVACIVALICAGCASRKVVNRDLPDQSQADLEQSLQQQDPSAKTPYRRDSSWVRPGEKISEQDLAKIDTSTVAPRYTKEEEIFRDIYFDYDQYDIRTDAVNVLQNISSWMLKNTSSNLLIEGHCDDRGTSEYNLALGDRRAKAVRDYLAALGVRSARMEILSYGEEQPICLEASESCWTKNRRAHFVVAR